MKHLLLIIFTIIFLTMNANDSTSLYYLKKEPKAITRKTPVLILLHGVGSNEEDLISFANQFPDKYLVISARAPITLGGNSFAWYQVDFSTGKPVYDFNQEEKSRLTIIKFIEEIKLKYAFDSSEIYLLGFSQGAIMSYSVALTRPDLVKGFVAMSGRLLEEIKPKIETDSKIQKISILITHGNEDNVLPVRYAKTTYDYLKSNGINTTLKEYQTGHEITYEMIKDVTDWLK